MTRNLFNYVIDLLSALVVIGLLGTGLIVKFVLPPGGGGRSLWGYTRHDWGDVHFWIAVAGMALVGVHLALHWTWVCVMTRRALWLAPRNGSGGSRWLANAFGVALLLAVGGLSTGLVYYGRASAIGGSARGGGGGGERRGWTESHDAAEIRESRGVAYTGGEIRGSMTLADAARVMGRSPDELIAALKLPASTPATEQLGRLRQKHGFTMSQVRSAFDAAGGAGTSQRVGEAH